ncbi:GldG family protein [Anaerocolumna sp. MB42-C2]|uniref:GldG family protein n=1 Tax=Anaerocolumna sp. MB42-C2 TaxID=3070997 RepID=UPI0027E0FE36|nr:GldG family protein [Anaerocolumna sp. MB42-C2]WMJ89650.1 GldG family protein [Anaerocolumna sp. MB42-C2]
MKDLNNTNQDNLNQDNLNPDNLNPEDFNQDEISQNDIDQDDFSQDEFNQEDTIQAEEENQDEIQGTVKKESITTKIKASFTSRKFKGGAYATTISAIVIIMILVVNIFVTELGLKIDVSKEGMYTLTDTTKDFVKELKDDITIYYIAQTGSEDKTFKEIVNKYDALSDKIKIEYKDPVLYPNFASDYTDEKLADNSVLVVNNVNKRAKYVANSDMYKTEIDYQTYQTNVTGIDVEGQITSALQYVTTKDLPVMYMVQGHGETAIGDTLASSFAKVNVTTNTLSTLTVKSIPDDCSILFINAPQKDYTKDEVAMIKDYLAKGGDAIILADYAAEGLDNFNSLMNYYGISFVKGIVLEKEQGYYMGQYVNNLVPSMKSHDITSSIISGKASIVAPSAIGIQVLDSKRSTTQIDPLLTTSDSAYSKIDVKSNTVEKQSGDIDGPFNLGVAITEKYNGVESKLVVLGSSLLIDESMMSYPSIGNLDLMLNSINFVADKESNLAIRTRSVTQQYLTMNAAQVNFWAIVIVVVIPVFVLAFGGYICIRRRKK